jgi:D-glycero-beta-D-manno-heptose-7-phosphate kinase
MSSVLALGALLDRLGDRSILVIGDLMIDQFVIGTVERISPEAPVPIVRFDHETWRLGGAANVANNVVALGGRVDAIGVVGDDADGSRLLEDLAGRSIGTAGIISDPSRCTTRKLRVVTTRNQQVARIDYEGDSDLASTIEATVVRRIGELAAASHAIVISDYLKGVVTPQVAAAAAHAARTQRIPLLVDPKVPHIDRYAGATVITPNHHEAESVTHMRIRTADEAREAARRFRDRAKCGAVLITRGEHGMWLLGPDPDSKDGADAEIELPAEAREVSDVTGAGDTVISALALASAAGASLVDAARLANRAAGIVVGKFGPATVTVDELR